MPKLKENPADVATREALGRIQGRTGWKDDHMADLIGRSRRTYQDRKRHPGGFTLEELRTLKKRAGLTDAEILNMIGG